MKTILMPIHPQWCEKIFNGEKTIEIRKTCPEPPFKVVAYCTIGSRHLALVSGEGTAQLFACCNWKIAIPCGSEIGNGKVIGEFVVNKVDTVLNKGSGFEIEGENIAYTNKVARGSCLDFSDLKRYFKAKNGKALHIAAPKLYDKPKALGEFYKRLPEKVLESGDYDCRKPWNCVCLDAPEGGDYCCNCEYGGIMRITRAPQSWQYIQDPAEEEVKEEIK